MAHEEREENTEQDQELEQKPTDTLEIGQHDDLEDETETEESHEVDYSQLTKEELIAALEKELATLKAETRTSAHVKRADTVVREVRPVLDQLKRGEWEEARGKYIADNESEEGFEYKHEAQTQRIEELCREIRGQKTSYYQSLEKDKEKNFAVKTALLQRLRELLEAEESRETDASDMKTSWEEFKKIQEEWKAAGNIASPHNGTLWATYNALIDRYFSNRNIYFELKELDRKRNAELKAELCEKLESLVATLAERPMSKEVLNEANQIFEEYKHVGPAPREIQEELWQRFKKSMDVLYDARRNQSDEQKKSMAEIYQAKSKIYEDIVPFTSFTSGSINDWNAKTKEILAFQDQWVAVKGPMPREEGKELSKKFWAALKAFFHNKGEFFKQLEAKREQNLKAKTALCEEVEEIIATGEDNPQNTQRVIEFQKKWKAIGQVPEKFKDSIYARFKQACDAYFNQKRAKNKEVERDFEENLAKKKELCERIEAAAEQDATIAQLNHFKQEWAALGFVPKKDMQAIQKRYIAAINAYVGAIGKLSSKEREQVVLESEVEMVREGETNRGLYRKESDIRRKISQLESDIAVWENNIQFFGNSKGSNKLKADFERRIEKASEQLNELKHQLSIIQEAI